MKAGTRVELRRKIAITLSAGEWADIWVTLEEFGLPVAGYHELEDRYEYCLRGLRGATDETLVELDGFLHGATQPTPEDEPWKTEDLRAFITHVSPQKVYASELKMGLASFGIEGFVAHEDIEPTKKWQRVIEASLQSCHALVALLHTGFRESSWCDQEVGFALARRIPIVAVRVDVQAYGFLGEAQSLNGTNLDSEQLASDVARLLLGDPRSAPLATERMVEALCHSKGFNQSNAVSSMLASEAPSITADQLRLMRDAQKVNDQVSGAYHVGWNLAEIERRFGITADATRPFDPSEEPF